MTADHPTTHYQARFGRDWVTCDTLQAAERAVVRLRDEAFAHKPDTRWSAVEPMIVGPLPGSACDVGAL
jgi:hypothetical protein